MTNLHSFAGNPTDGMSPWGTLLLSGSTLYGMTSAGGTILTSGVGGVLFKVNTDGTGYNLLHSFAGPGDGSTPYGDVTIVGSTLYGMTSLGGTSSNGVIFKINTDGTGYGIMHNFNGGANDGAVPYGSLVAGSSTLYGMTAYGGSNNYGAIIKINTSGTGFGVIHAFDGYNGYRPELSALTLSGSTLYGTATGGGLDRQRLSDDLRQSVRRDAAAPIPRLRSEK